MTNSNAVNLRPSYKSNTIGTRKQLARGYNAARQPKFVTANPKASASVSSNIFRQVRGEQVDTATYPEDDQVHDGTNGSMEEDMILAVNEQPR